MTQPTSEPRKHRPKMRWRQMRWGGLDYTQASVCEDCGTLVIDKDAHTRRHSIHSSWAWTLAVLKTSHISAVVHDRYDTDERINSRQFDNWSADALAEVMKDIPDA